MIWIIHHFGDKKEYFKWKLNDVSKKKKSLMLIICLKIEIIIKAT